MSNFKIRKDAYGEIIYTPILGKEGDPAPLQGITVSTFIFQRPDDTFVNKTGAVVPSGINYLASYQIEEGLLNQVGHWKYQATVAASGIDFHMGPDSITVLGNLE